MKEDIHRIISISRSVSQTVYPRKNTVWTREKITQLIELYKKHDCLWNHWNDSYKNKEKRNRAIEEICSILSISKFDFGKKIHNLRNQFNSEMKKLEQRLEAGGGVGYVSEISSSSRSENGDTNSDDNKPILRCKWSHFESLMFLKDVIEPRPGGYQSTFHSSKNLRIKLDYNKELEDPEANSNLSHQSNNVTNGTRIINNSLAPKPAATVIDGNSRLVIVNGSSSSLLEINDQDSSNKQIRTYQFTNDQEQIQENQRRCSATTVDNSEDQNELLGEGFQSCSSEELRTMATNKNSLIDPLITNTALELYDPGNISTGDRTNTLTASSVVAVTNTNGTVKSNENGAGECRAANVINSNSIPILASSVSGLRDQWDTFGDLIATEFRHLNSDISRKKLKRKIMQAMLEVGEDDDKLAN